MSKIEPPGILPLDSARPFLEPLVPILLESFWEAWEWSKGLIDKDEKARMILHSSTMAGMVSDAFGHFCRPRLNGNVGARWTTSGRFQRAVIKQAVALRFKKMTPDLLSMNVRTESQRKVYQQDAAALPGARAITHITMGYTLNTVATEPTGIYFACPEDFEKNRWVWPIYETGDGQLSLFIGTPLPPDEEIEDVLDVDIKVGKRRKAENG